MDHISYTIVIEEISRVCASTGVILSAQNSLYAAIRSIISGPKNKRKNSWSLLRAAKKSAASR